LLGLILASLILAVDVAGEGVRRHFGQMGDQLSSGTRPPVQIGSTDRIEDVRFAEIEDTPLADKIRFPLTALLLVALAIAWNCIRRTELKKELLKLPLEDSRADLNLNMQVQARFVAKRQQILRSLTSEMGRLLQSNIEVRHLMTKRVSTVLPSATIEELTEKMSELDVHHLLVCAKDRQLLGVISDRDLKKGKGKTARDIMTAQPLTVSPQALVRPAVTFMLDRHISSLPVVDEGKLVGILTTTDLIMALQCTMQVVQQIATDLLPQIPIQVADDEAIADPLEIPVEVA
jgi:CBS domain-containing protein